MSIERILDIEQGLSNRLTDEWQPLYVSYMTRLLTALKLGNVRAATAIVDSLSLSSMVGNLGDAFDSYSAMSFTFGCQQVAKYQSAENDCHKDSIELLKNTLNKNVLDQITQASIQLISNFNKVQKAEDSILHEFQSFAGKVNSKAKQNLRIASQLHTSRLASYGFTAEANVRGWTEYAINAQLDKRICKVCRVMHGRIFKVAEARNLLQRVLRTKDPDELATLQPWPSMAKAPDMVTMTAAQLVAQGWHIPPMHPSCRCMLSSTKNVPNIVDVPSAVAAGLPTRRYKPHENDFLATGLPHTPEILDAWNTGMTVSPMRLLGKLFGLDEGLITRDLLTTRAYNVALTEKELVFKVNDLLFGSKTPVQYKGALNLLNKSATLDMLALAEEDAVIGKEIFGAAIDAFETAGIETVGVNANIGTGSYAMAKYGYVPNSPLEWERLRKNWITKPWRRLRDVVPEMVRDAVDAILQSDDPFAIWELADIGYKVNGTPLGQKLLENTQWWGELAFSDPSAMQRFNNYFKTV